MDPLTLGIGAVGLGMQLFGGLSAASKANEAYGVQQNITGLEQGVNTQRHDQMTLSASRQQLENFRNVQRVRAQGVNAAVNQGAQYGSGLKGGQAQAQDQGYFNDQDVTQNLQIGNNIFGLDNQISSDKMRLSGIQSSMATDTAISSLGGAMVKDAGTIGNIGGAVSSFLGNFSSLMRPGSISGGF